MVLSVELSKCFKCFLSKTSADDDDTEWEKLQRRLSKREKALEGKRKQSHSVHCPFFPEVSLICGRLIGINFCYVYCD